MALIVWDTEEGGHKTWRTSSERKEKSCKAAMSM